jgi:hypothetical protein
VLPAVGTLLMVSALEDDGSFRFRRLVFSDAMGARTGIWLCQVPTLEVTLTKLLVSSPKGYQLAGLSVTVILVGCDKELKLC